MIKTEKLLQLACLLAAAVASTNCFTVKPTISTRSLNMLHESYPGVDFSGDGLSSGKVGSIEQIEFKIYPDGRVEETVRGVKGGNCHKVTEKINEALGKVVQSAPTEEMYEQEVVADQTLTQTDGASWEGSTPSSW